MKELNKREITLLKTAIDLTITTIGNELSSTQKDESRLSHRKTMSEYLELSEKVNKLTPKI